jgi:hypothetical protein
MTATGLIQPFSRVEYQYRVRTGAEAARWRDDFAAAFPTVTAEVRSFDERSDRMAEEGRAQQDKAKAQRQAAAKEAEAEKARGEAKMEEQRQRSNQ